MPTTWLVSEPYHPEQTGTGYYITTLAEHLALDRDVRVLCGQPTYSSRGVRAPHREIRNGVGIRRCRGTTLDKDVLAFRLCNLVTLGVSLFVAALRGLRRGDIAIVVTNPPTQPYLLLLACRLRGARCVVLVHDRYPEIAVAVGMLDRRSSITRVMTLANRMLVRRADAVIVVGRDMRDSVAAATGIRPADIAVLPNWPEAGLVPDRGAGAAHRVAWGAADDQVVALCAGNLGRPSDLAVLVGAADRLRDDDRLLFVFLGHGVKRAWLEAEVGERALTNILIVDREPRSAQSRFLNAADVGIVPLVAGMQGVAVPSRSYNLFATGVPILAILESGAEIARIIEDEGAGWVSPPGDVDHLVTVLETIADDPAARRAAGERAAAVGRRDDLASAMAAYRQFLDDLDR